MSEWASEWYQFRAPVSAANPSSYRHPEASGDLRRADVPECGLRACERISERSLGSFSTVEVFWIAPTPFGPRSPPEGHTCPTGTGTECPDRRCWVGTKRPPGPP